MSNNAPGFAHITLNTIKPIETGIGTFEGSWDLPRSFQDLEVFGFADKGSGSLYMQNGKVELKKGRQAESVQIEPLPPERAEPIAYMVYCLRNHKQIEGMTAIDINVDVIEIIDAAKESLKTGKPVDFKRH